MGLRGYGVVRLEIRLEGSLEAGVVQRLGLDLNEHLAPGRQLSTMN